MLNIKMILDFYKTSNFRNTWFDRQESRGFLDPALTEKKKVQKLPLAWYIFRRYNLFTLNGFILVPQRYFKKGTALETAY